MPVYWYQVLRVTTTEHISVKFIYKYHHLGLGFTIFFFLKKAKKIFLALQDLQCVSQLLNSSVAEQPLTV